MEISHTTPRARKRHRCDHCGDMIEPGTVYDRTVDAWDGLRTFRSHVECAAAANDLHKIIEAGYEGVNLSCDLEIDDVPWLREDHPLVAARFKELCRAYDDAARRREEDLAKLPAAAIALIEEARRQQAARAAARLAATA